MELWIRSQDRLEIAKAQDIQIHEDEDKTIHIWNYGTWKNYLGQYKTKERALEVLDEIDKCMSNAVNNGLNVARYEMPKE